MDPGLLGNRYQVVRSIGTGGTTRVLEAWDREGDCRVAIKVPIGRFANDKAFLVRLEREVAALAGFSHPNAAKVYAVERHGGAGFVVAELVEAPSLREVLAARGALRPARAARATAGACAALATAHARGIVHGHLTPANVLMSGDGRVKLTDFRLAEAARPFATAPNPAADLRALGRCLAAMLIGRELADGEPVRLSPEVPPELAPIVARATGDPELTAIMAQATDDPTDPYSSAADFGRDLDRFLEAVQPGGVTGKHRVTVAHDPTGTSAPTRARTAELVPTGAPRPRAPLRLTPPKRRRRRIVVAAGVVAAGLAVSGPFTAAKLLGGGETVVFRPDLAAPAPPSTVASISKTSRAPATLPTTTVQPATTAPAAVPVIAAPNTSPATTKAVDPGPKVVPNVVGLHRQQASGALAQAGLEARISFTTARDPGQVQRVIAQQPAAGALVPAGSTVTVLVGSKKAG